MTVHVHPPVPGHATVASHAPTVEIGLYYVIGGRPALVVAVDKLYGRLLDDPVIGPLFPNGVSPKHRQFVVTFLAQALGGPERYHGPDLGDVHGHVGITDAIFDRTAGHLDAALDELGLPRGVIDRIIAVVAGLRPTLVTA
jgi:hemoglobin